MEDEYFGPALPPESGTAEENEANKGKYPKEQGHLKRKRSHSSSSSFRDSSSDSCTNSSNESGCSVQKGTSERIETLSEVNSISQRPAGDGASSCFIGPVIPTGFLTREGEDEADEWGPLPPGDNDDRGIQSTAEEIERRAERMKNRLLNPIDEVLEIPGRETWMTELPPERGKNFGLTARKFSMATHSTSGDRSVWTETPADRDKRIQGMASGGESTGKPTEKNASEQSRTVKRDLEYSQQVEEYNKSKKRSKSLLELHNEKHKKQHKKQKKEKHKEKKKKRKKEEKEKKKNKRDKDLERRPFDRDVDLKVNRMDDVQRKAIIKRSQQLTGRFGHGSSTGKFL